MAYKSLTNGEIIDVLGSDFSEDSDSDRSSSDESIDTTSSSTELSSNESENDDASKCNTVFQWRNNDNVPKLIPFIGKPDIGPNILNALGNNPSEMDIFSQFIGDEFWQMVCVETNDYANKMLNDPNRKKLKSDGRWQALSLDEMRAYFALYILIGQVKKPKLQMNWSKRKVIETPIYAETMSFARFTSISRFLHFSDDDFTVVGDKLWKLRPVISYLQTKFMNVYELEKDITIDESLMKLRARVDYIQFNRTKRARFGIKIYKLCESSSGYCADFKVYTGAQPNLSKLPVSEVVVQNLMEPFVNKGHVLHLDNWYSSPLLYKALLEKDTHVIGTVRANRKEMPKQFMKVKLKKGDAIAMSANNILAVKWKDRKDVHVLSTLHENLGMEMVRVRTKRGGGQENVVKPACVIAYNKGMLGVDRQDQVLASFPIMRRTAKAYKKVFFYFMDMAIFNSFVSFKKLQTANGSRHRLHYTHFRINLAEQILQSVELHQRCSPGRAAFQDNPLRLQSKGWAHFPMQIPPTEKKKFPSRACRVCAKQKKRAEVRWLCQRCQVPLHLGNCFKLYHSKLNY